MQYQKQKQSVIGPVILVILVILVALIVWKNQRKESPVVQGCPQGTEQVLLTDGTTECATVNLDESKTIPTQ